MQYCTGANSRTLRSMLLVAPRQSFSNRTPVNSIMCVRPAREQNGLEPQNSNYKNDIVHVIKHSRWILSSIGIWPVVSQGAKRFLPYVAIGLSNSVLLFAIIPCIPHIVCEEKEPIMILRLVGLLSFCLASFMKYGALSTHRRRIKECIEQVHDDWRQVGSPSDRELMLKYGKMGRNLTILCAVFMYTGGVIYHTIAQYAIGTFVDENNRTIKPLVYPTYSGLYDAQANVVYEVVYIVHCMCGYVIYSVTTGACGLAALFAMHVCGQIDVAMARLGELVDRRWNSDPTVRLIYYGCLVIVNLGINSQRERLNCKECAKCRPEQRPNSSFLNIIVTALFPISEITISCLTITGYFCNCCRRSKYTISVSCRFSAMVETILQEVCFVEVLTSTFIICLLEYYIITAWETNDTITITTYILLLISLTFNIFILCYIGELLMQKTSDIGLSCFAIDWYHLPAKTARDLVLIIAMSSKPVKISAGKIVDLNLSTFANVLKTSVVYLSFLRTTVLQ